jgi:hypothetical protein
VTQFDLLITVLFLTLCVLPLQRLISVFATSICILDFFIVRLLKYAHFTQLSFAKNISLSTHIRGGMKTFAEKKVREENWQKEKNLKSQISKFFLFSFAESNKEN